MVHVSSPLKLPDSSHVNSADFDPAVHPSSQVAVQAAASSAYEYVPRQPLECAGGEGSLPHETAVHVSEPLYRPLAPHAKVEWPPVYPVPQVAVQDWP